MSSDEATKDVIEKQIPEVVRQNKSGALNVENIDVFCEKGVFNVEQTKSILQVGKDLGNLRINFHGEELNYLGSVEVRYPNIFISTIVFTWCTVLKENQKFNNIFPYSILTKFYISALIYIYVPAMFMPV